LRFDGLILDFDGVLLESEWASNAQIADFLTRSGHPTSVEEAMRHFMGLSGQDFVDAVARWAGGALPQGFAEARAEEDRRVLAEGLVEVAGAIAFVRALPPDLPKAVASSSSSEWIRTHLRHLGLADAFGDHIYSGREHVARGKPAPDLYHHAAAAIGVAIERCAIVEDSPVGARGALASGATVIGFVGGLHCLDGHEQRLRDLGVRHIAHNFDEVAAFLA
jgi:HAD superfamily hydrolase (TIGR01509 family)